MPVAAPIEAAAYIMTPENYDGLETIACFSFSAKNKSRVFLLDASSRSIKSLMN
jgi:hypothetical protein